MASDPTATLSRLLGNTTIVDHEEVLKATNAILKKKKGDFDALHTRVVALLKLDRYADALRALDEGGDRLAEVCTFERAYALYKTGELEQASQIYESLKSGKKGRALAHVAAQAAYKSEDNKRAAELYSELRKRQSVIEGETNDIRINSLAIAAQNEWAGNGYLVRADEKSPQREDLDVFELCYNHACACIARGDLKAGLMMLQRAKTLCENIDDLTDEEKRAEILSMMVQEVYALTKLGEFEKAAAIERDISISEISEAPTKHIATNNVLASQQPWDNPYLAERLISSLPALGRSEQLFAYQALPISLNRYITSLATQKHSGVARATSEILDAQVKATADARHNSLSVLNAAARAQCAIDKSALKTLLPLLEKRPTDVGLALTVAQLYINSPTPSLQAATAVVENLLKRLEAAEALEVRYAPGLVGIIVALHRAQGRTSPIKKELSDAAQYWTKSGNPTRELYKAAGLALVDSNQEEDLKAAKELFGKLREDDRDDETALAGYIAASASSDLSTISSELEQLPSVSDLISGIDIDALESGGIASLPVNMVDASRKRSVAAVEQPKKKRLRKSQLPKDYVEGKEMDPERWLPLKDRSSYKPKGKKGKKKMMESTQGGVINEDLVAKVESAGVVKQQGGNKQGKKKKGKR